MSEKNNLIPDLRFAELTLEQIAEYPNDMRPMEMIAYALHKDKANNIGKYSSLFFLADLPHETMAAWVMKAKLLIDHNVVKPEADSNILDKLLAVQTFYHT